MPWVVDTCILIDIAIADPLFGERSAALLETKRTNGLVICPVTYVEMAPVFAGDATLLEKFLFHTQIAWSEDWTRLETMAAHAAWNRYVQARRQIKVNKRPVADILIGAFAEKYDGLLTRNPSDFRNVFPTLKIESV